VKMRNTRTVNFLSCVCVLQLVSRWVTNVKCIAWGGDALMTPRFIPRSCVWCVRFAMMISTNDARYSLNPHITLHKRNNSFDMKRQKLLYCRQHGARRAPFFPITCHGLTVDLLFLP
jgi:hypothetical protein